MPSPSFPGVTNILKGVAARSEDDAWAVGYYRDAFNYLQTLILHWNGVAWSIVPSPTEVGNVGRYLYGVSIVGKSDVWAAGFIQRPSDEHTMVNLVLHWNGIAWVENTVPNPGEIWNLLFSVTGISSDKAHAVGGYKPDSGGQSGWKDTEALVWRSQNGWQFEPNTPNPGFGENIFYGSAPVTSNYLWAVGFAGTDPTGTGRTLIARRVNNAWTQVPSPNVGSRDNVLRGVTVEPGTNPCAGGNNWAVGYYVDNSGVVRTLAMSYYITPICNLTP